MTPEQRNWIKDFIGNEKVRKHFAAGEISLMEQCHGTSLIGQDAYHLVGLLNSISRDSFEPELDAKRAKVIISRIKL